MFAVVVTDYSPLRDESTVRKVCGPFVAENDAEKLQRKINDAFQHEHGFATVWTITNPNTVWDELIPAE